jgi:LacI family transcriptional regulator
VPTLRDVAAAAGVSIATASRALSGTRGVSPPNERAVKAAAARLGYSPNGVARALRSHKTHMVGVVVPHIANPFFPRVVQELERTLQLDGRAILLVDSQGNAETERDRIEALVHRQVDALVIVPAHPRDSGATLEAAAKAMPVVQLDRSVPGVDTDRVATDHSAGIVMAVDHLLDTGRERLAFIGARSALPAVTARGEAFLGRLRERGLAEPRETLLGEFSIAWGREAAGRVVASGTTIDGIVCANDLIAIGVLQQLHAAGVRVPEDVCVTGFDDVGFAEVTDPQLTTIRQPVQDLGRASAELVTSRIDRPDQRPRTVTLQPELVIRGSTREHAHRRG